MPGSPNPGVNTSTPNSTRAARSRMMLQITVGICRLLSARSFRAYAVASSPSAGAAAFMDVFRQLK